MNEVMQSKYLTVEDYYNLPYKETARSELEQGLLLMSPSPSGKHQQIYFGLGRQLQNYFDNKSCVVLPDYDVQLFEDEDTIYQPDLLVLCDLSKYTDQRIIGAPDFIIEVASPGSEKNDLGKKRLNYERAGVKEYWVVRNPYLVHVYLLNDGKYTETVYRNEQIIKTTVFADLAIDFIPLQNLRFI
ncbi:MAG: Uma2 family endonuclease [Spirochaetaceae bacterium]|nr:Uma2 family endonuclease [Spirochaetaceae bacterium]